jgi:iron complex outermembrane recepter protein
MYPLRCSLAACAAGVALVAPVAAQTATEPPAGSTPAPATSQLPPLVVESSPAKSKKQAKKKSAAKTAAAPVASPAPTPPQQAQPSASGQSAYGPVDGYVATQASAGTKTDAPLIEIPQAISVVTRDQMDDRKVESLNDALRYTAGVQAGDTADLTQETFAIRGFNTPYQSVYRDGLREMFRGFDSTPAWNGLRCSRGPRRCCTGKGCRAASSIS